MHDGCARDATHCFVCIDAHAHSTKRSTTCHTPESTTHPSSHAPTQAFDQVVKAHELLLQYCVEAVEGDAAVRAPTNATDMDPMAAWYDAAWSSRHPQQEPQNAMLSVNRHRIVIKVRGGVFPAPCTFPGCGYDAVCVPL